MPVAKNPKRQYLKKRGEGWYLNVPIPVDLREQFLSASGKPNTHIVKTLETQSLEEAYRRKLIQLPAILSDFDRRAKELKGSLPHDLRGAIAFRRDYQRALADRHPHNRDEGPDQADLLELVAEDVAQHIYEQAGGTKEALKHAQTHFKIAIGAETLIEAFDEWIQKGVLPPRTQAKYRTALNEFLGFLGPGHHLIPEMNRKNAIRYVDWLNSEAKSQRTKKVVPLSYNTKRDRVMALSAFWNQGLSARDKTKEQINPWSKLNITEKPTTPSVLWDTLENAGRPKRRQDFTDADLIAILDAEGPHESRRTSYTKRTLMEVFVLGLMTGARPDELCSLHLKDVKLKNGIYWLSLVDGKNADSDRTIPVAHPLAVGILDRRIDNRTEGSEQLFKEFRPKQGHTSLYELVGRALSRHLQRASGIESNVVPYCTRHTLQTRMGNREDVKDAVMQRYVGHKPSTMTDKHYRTIQPAALLEFAKKITYPHHVEARMAEELELNSAHLRASEAFVAP